jgi:hypothetical protein
LGTGTKDKFINIIVNNIYTIFSSGRTGSHVILEMLSGPTKCPGGLADAYAIWLPHDLSENQNIIQHYLTIHNVVIHLHNINLIKELDPANVTLIISLRRDVFAQAMSGVVASIVDEWSGKNYSNKIVKPIVFDQIKFISLVESILNWQQRVDLCNYKKVVTIYYEDLITYGAEFLARELNLEYAKSKIGHVYQKSPYSYKDIILNWEELYQEYLKILNP